MQILLLISILIYVCTIIYYNKNSKKIYKRYIQKRKKEIDRELDDKIAQKEGLEEIIQERKRAVRLVEEQLSQGRIRREELVRELDDYEQLQRKKIEVRVAEIEKEKLQNVDLKIEQEYAVKRLTADESHRIHLSALDEAKKAADCEMSRIMEELEAYRAKQTAINEEILRRREMQEQTDFYRVCLSEDAIADINLLQVTRQNLKKPEIIDKIIYDTYVAKPVLEMVKRVLQNSTCSGIYKITCQETKEIYIGKSTDIKNRWQQHCKTAFNCGTIASSILHRKMQQYGIENFTFEVLERVPKSQLAEREKYYIDFYKTKETGLNERNG